MATAILNEGQHCGALGSASVPAPSRYLIQVLTLTPIMDCGHWTQEKESDSPFSLPLIATGTGSTPETDTISQTELSKSQGGTSGSHGSVDLFS